MGGENRNSEEKPDSPESEKRSSAEQRELLELIRELRQELVESEKRSSAEQRELLELIRELRQELVESKKAVPLEEEAQRAIEQFELRKAKSTVFKQFKFDKPLEKNEDLEDLRKELEKAGIHCTSGTLQTIMLDWDSSKLNEAQVRSKLKANGHPVGPPEPGRPDHRSDIQGLDDTLVKQVLPK